jgi:hypothetical protein
MLQKLFEFWFLSETKAKRLLCRMRLPPELYAAFTFLAFWLLPCLDFGPLLDRNMASNNWRSSGQLLRYMLVNFKNQRDQFRYIYHISQKKSKNWSLCVIIILKKSKKIAFYRTLVLLPAISWKPVVFLRVFQNQKQRFFDFKILKKHEMEVLKKSHTAPTLVEDVSFLCISSLSFQVLIWNHCEVCTSKLHERKLSFMVHLGQTPSVHPYITSPKHTQIHTHIVLISMLWPSVHILQYFHYNRISIPNRTVHGTPIKRT